MHCNLAKKLVGIYQMNSTGWMLEYFLPLITVVQAAVKIHPAGGIPGTFCHAHAKFFGFFRDCYSVNLNLGMGSGIPTIRYPNMEKYPDEFEIAETQMMIRPIRAKWFSKDFQKILLDLLNFTIKEGYTDQTLGPALIELIMALSTIPTSISTVTSWLCLHALMSQINWTSNW